MSYNGSEYGTGLDGAAAAFGAGGSGGGATGKEAVPVTEDGRRNMSRALSSMGVHLSDGA